MRSRRRYEWCDDARTNERRCASQPHAHRRERGSTRRPSKSRKQRVDADEQGEATETHSDTLDRPVGRRKARTAASGAAEDAEEDAEEDTEEDTQEGMEDTEDRGAPDS